MSIFFSEGPVSPKRLIPPRATMAGPSDSRSSGRLGSFQSSEPERLLIEGDTCWRRALAARAAVLIDAASYFEALRSSLLAARRSVFSDSRSIVTTVIAIVGGIATLLLILDRLNPA